MLETIGHNLAVYTPILPESTRQVVQLMAAGVGRSLLDAAAPDFAHHVVASADAGSEAPPHFGLRQAERAARLAEVVLDPDAGESAHYGSLAMLAAMALLYESNPSGENDARRQGARAIGAVGLEQLLAIRDELDGSDADFVDQMLRESAVDPVCFAIELIDLPREVDEYLVDPVDAYEGEVYATTKPLDQELIGDAVETPVADLALDQESLAKIDWIDFSKVTSMSLRPVHRDGEVVAYVADLTQFHHALRKMTTDLTGNDTAYEKFRNLLAFSIFNYLVNPRSARRTLTEFQKLPTYLAGNVKTSNDQLVRAYYALIGAHQDDLPVIGLLAGFRTKDNQPSALQIISRQHKRSARRADG
jgi:hypothetical protein